MRAEQLEDHGIHVVGSRSGNTKTQCPQCGHSGMRTNPRDKSLSVDVDRGVWFCHYCGWKGAIKTGDRSLFGRPFQPKVYAKPKPIEPVPDGLTPAAVAFFTDRKIDMGAVKRRGITVGADGALKFPYYRDGHLVNVKSRWRKADGSKGFRMEEGCELVFWGLDECKGAEQIVIVEGEPDLLACETAGITHVLSVPNGAQANGSLAYLESAQDLIEAAHTIILAVDSDSAGQALEVELARRIGKSKCCRARFPEGCKDANEVLIAHGPDVLRGCIADAEEFPVDGAKWLSSFVESAVLLRRTQPERGASTGWRNVDELYTVTPGELTVVTGVPGSGKSEWLDSLMMNLAQYAGWSFAVYSPESGSGEEHFIRLAKKYLNKPYWPGPTTEMTDDELRHFGAWGAHKFLLLDPENPSVSTLLGMARGFVFRHGIQGLVIDPWNRLDHARDSGALLTEHVRDSLSLLSDFAKRNDIHIWLMAHPKKMEVVGGVPAVPTAYDISDSAHFFNMADNIIVVNRNKGDDTSPVEIRLQKVRRQRVGKLGMAMLRFDRVTGRYYDVRGGE